MSEKLSITTKQRCELVDITETLDRLLAESGRCWKNGFLVVFSPHTTCGVTVNEGYDPDVRSDMVRFLKKLVPCNWGFDHAEGNSDAHLKTAFFGVTAMIPVSESRLDLGQWQRVYLCECDGPRRRTLDIRFIRAE